MAPTDWMQMTPSDWMEMAYGDVMRTPASELMGNAYWTAPAPPPPAGAPPPGTPPWMGGGFRRQHWMGRRRPGPHRDHHHDCGCGSEEGCPRCNADPCQCYCCIGDVDLAVYSRVGELRVIPIVIENERRREKEINLDLSDWTTRSGKPAPVRTRGLTPTKFTLGPCEERTVVLGVQVFDDDAANAKANAGAAAATATAAGKASGKRGEVLVGEGERELPDVDECLVAIADLRVEGCDHRPVRIAVAILPRDCDPFTVSCGCSCC
jgi:hypothetical protein